MSLTGFIESGLDSRDIVFESPRFNYPSSLDYSRDLPLVRDQGSVSKCVSVAVTDMINWRLKFLNQTNLSRDDIFYKNRTNRSVNGMTPRDAFNYLTKVGVSTNLGVYRSKLYSRIFNYSYLKSALATNGPVLIALPVYNYDREFWKGDRLKGYHAVLIVGYNHNSFIIRNSWGSNFGDNGYTELKFNDINKIVECWTLIN